MTDMSQKNSDQSDFRRLVWETRAAWIWLLLALGIALVGDLLVMIWWPLGAPCLALTSFCVLASAYRMIEWLCR